MFVTHSTSHYLLIPILVITAFARLSRDVRLKPNQTPTQSSKRPNRPLQGTDEARGKRLRLRRMRIAVS